MENPDDLRSGLEAAFETHTQEEQPVEQVTQPVQETPVETQDGRPRDESGRFVKAEKQEPDAPQQPEQAPQAPQAPEVKAPSSWKPEAQSAYVKGAKGEPLTPEEIKLLTAEAERRESDYHKGIEGLKPNAQLGRQFQEVLQPYMQTIQQLGVDPVTAAAKLFQTEHILRYGDPATKAQMFANLAQQYGVDIGQLGNAPQVDPQVQYLQQQLAQTQGQVQQFFTQQQQQQHAQVMSEIDRFASDPANAHFEAVRDEMAVLLQTGKAQDLKSAYDMAVWMRPDIRQSLIEQQRAEAQRQAQEQAQAARAKAASVGVKGSSPVAAVAAPAGDSVRDALLAAFDQT